MSDKEILTADITALSSEGAGIGRSDGIAVFVPGALPGEKATVEVAARRKNYITARLLSRGAKSPDRVDPVCPHYAACGGCGIMHMSYAAQLRFKRDKVAAAVLRIGGSDIGVDDAVPSPDILRYRNKICLQVRAEADGAVKIGFFREGTHVVADIDDCPLFCGGAARVIEIFRRFLKSGGITAYREDGGTGLLKHIIIRRLDGVTIVTAVVTDAGEAAYGEIGEALRKEQGGGIVFYVNVNPAGGKILGAVTRAVTVGADSVRTVCGLKVSVSPESFFQVNDGVSARIYGDILLAAADIGPRAVIDAYCGAGLLTAMLASAVRKPTHGVEIVREAAADARALVKRNNIADCAFTAGDCAVCLPEVMKKYRTPRTLLVLDPPRKGCDPSVIHSVIAARPSDVIYLSCDPATLARDLKLLSAAYAPVFVRPYDMFPQTAHVETLVRLKLRV